jgi:hypothetical protein
VQFGHLVIGRVGRRDIDKLVSSIHTSPSGRVADRGGGGGFWAERRARRRAGGGG